MAHARTRRFLIATVIVLGLVLIPPLFKANRLRSSLASSLSAALGRKVTMDQVHLNVLPRPGFRIYNLKIADDPEYGFEPILQAGEVRADLRLASFWRGRIEIAHLLFKYPSLNLTRNVQGPWNVESLLMRASQVKSAPTALQAQESRPRFPYIETENGRINLKSGDRKQAFTLADADFALWLETDDQWNLRLSARPLRTDANLTDTGMLNIQGSFYRTENIYDIPIDLSINAEKIQLGQLTMLLLGQDKGWRGELEVKGGLKGKLSELEFKSTALLHGFHRYDIQNPGTVDLPIQCSGRYVWPKVPSKIHIAPQDRTVNCTGAPLFPEVIFNQYFDSPETPASHTTLDVTESDLTKVLPFVRQMKANLPADLKVEGKLDFHGYFELRAQNPFWSVTGNIKSLNIASQATDAVLRVPLMEFGTACYYQSLKNSAPCEICSEHFGNCGIGQHGNKRDRDIAIKMFPMNMGAKTPLTINAAFTRNGQVIRLKGDGQLLSLRKTLQMFGVPLHVPDISGATSMDLALTNPWARFTAPVLTGNVKLKNASAILPGLTTPTMITSADATLTESEVRIENLHIEMRGSNSVITGSITVPRICNAPECFLKFNLHANELDLAETGRWLGLVIDGQGILDKSKNLFLRDKPSWYERPVGGDLYIDHLIAGTLSGRQIHTKVQWLFGKLTLTGLDGVWSGNINQTTWATSFDGKLPYYDAQLVIRSIDGKILSIPQVINNNHPNANIRNQIK